MNAADFKRFCTAMANSCAHRASVLNEKINPDTQNRATISELEHRVNILTDQTEVWANAPERFR